MVIRSRCGVTTAREMGAKRSYLIFSSYLKVASHRASLPVDPKVVTPRVLTGLIQIEGASDHAVL